MNKQTHLEQHKVNHDFLYHAEIMFETKDAFDYKSAVGNNLKELLIDIDVRLKELSNRNPQIVQALYKPQNESINITPKIISLLKFKPYYSSNKTQ
ncbi:MAG: hypothetical protein Unbinned6747contig1000_14 [Prokaryotic dsDNA virus sp.]|nr:MAG: hypothetical protein Unbinned6747contig1000_14 [Prokaryotic dsDNA virus sp.]|tara:strand:+ start:22765 stop:23052 length:288 start_codon:yes stop_codon:yes gene_type:complete